MGRGASNSKLPGLATASSSGATFFAPDFFAPYFLRSRFFRSLLFSLPLFSLPLFSIPTFSAPYFFRSLLFRSRNPTPKLTLGAQDIYETTDKPRYEEKRNRREADRKRGKGDSETTDKPTGAAQRAGAKIGGPSRVPIGGGSSGRIGRRARHRDFGSDGALFEPDKGRLSHTPPRVPDVHRKKRGQPRGPST